MTQFALIEEEKIVNVLVADKLEDLPNFENTEYIDLTNHPDNPGIGYERVDGKFILNISEN